MPIADYTLYANFADQLRLSFFDGFESRAVGDLDMNDGSGANKGTNGTSANPWFGNCPPDMSVTAAVNGVTPHSGTKMVYVTGYGCQDAVNVAYRCNNSHPYAGGVYLDWFFYDPLGAATNANTYQDYVGLTNYSSPVLPVGGNTTQDYGTFGTCASAFGGSSLLQALGIGAAQDQGTGYLSGVYQIHVTGDSTGYHGGWTNTSVARSSGWHHARILVDAANTTGMNDVSFYIDDMATAAAIKDSATAIGYNSILMNMKPQNMVTGYMDDIAFGPIPDTPVGAPAAAGWTADTGHQIVWNWTQAYPMQGFKLYDSETDGNLLQTMVGAATTATETGLAPNTQYLAGLRPTTVATRRLTPRCRQLTLLRIRRY